MESRDEKYYHASLKHYAISRRGLFRGLFSGAKKALKSQQTSFIVREVPRPPGAIEEGVFRALCQSCTSCEKACAKACPEQVIEIVEGFPQLNLDYNHCTHCAACANACPSGAIAQNAIKETISAHGFSADIGLRPVFSNTCNHRISGSCEACEKACPANAITLIPHSLPTLNNTACIGCGQCRSACFVGAIQLNFKVAL